MAESESVSNEHELNHPLSSGYLCGLWNLPNKEEVIKKLEIHGIPYTRRDDGEIEVMSKDIPVGGKFDDEK